MLKFLLFGLLATSQFAVAEVRVLSAERIRLGEPDAPEWEWFENDPARPGPLELKFAAKPNSTEATLFIHQADVKLEWRVHLNGKRLERLQLIEEELVQTIPVPAGALVEGENVLTILPPVGNHDDIVLRDIVLDFRPVKEAVGEATLAVEVEGEGEGRLPVRITVADDAGVLQPLIALPGQMLAVRPGVAYTGDGSARLGLRPGHYVVHASRGFEYSMASEKVELKAGDTRKLALRIKREVVTPGWVSSDPHIHTLELSRHGDAGLDERMLTIAGENVELPVATEHNLHADYAEAAKRTGMDRYFTPVRGNEVTTSVGHFNIFPVDAGAPVPNAKLTAWPEILAGIRAVPGVRVIQLNHPRGLHSGFVPFGPENFDAAAGTSKGKIEFSFNAIEALNSGAQQTDYMLVLRDWFALLNRGHRITALGGSDSHDVSRFIVGHARTYLAVPDAHPGRIDIAAACDSLVAGRAIVSMGLLPQITVEDRFTVGDLATNLPEQVRVRVKVLGPSWVRGEKVELYANGEKIQEAAIPAEHAAAPGEKADILWTIPRPKQDTHLVVIASGPAVTAPFWAMSRPYQPISPKWTGRSLGFTNPVWLDGDGDGKRKATAEER